MIDGPECPSYLSFPKVGGKDTGSLREARRFPASRRWESDPGRHNPNTLLPVPENKTGWKPSPATRAPTLDEHHERDRCPCGLGLPSWSSGQIARPTCIISGDTDSLRGVRRVVRSSPSSPVACSGQPTRRSTRVPAGRPRRSREEQEGLVPSTDRREPARTPFHQTKHWPTRRCCEQDGASYCVSMLQDRSILSTWLEITGFRTIPAASNPPVIEQVARSPRS